MISNPTGANSAHSTILFLLKPASPTGIGGRSKVNKTVPVREPLGFMANTKNSDNEIYIFKNNIYNYYT